MVRKSVYYYRNKKSFIYRNNDATSNPNGIALAETGLYDIILYCFNGSSLIEGLQGISYYIKLRYGEEW